MKSITDQTLYEILEIPSDASTSTIVAAVERARSLYGPGSIATYSLVPAEESDLLSRRVDEAEATLLDADARARYDEALASVLPPARSGPPRAAPVVPAMRVVPIPPPGEPLVPDPSEELGEAAGEATVEDAHPAPVAPPAPAEGPAAPARGRAPAVAPPPPQRPARKPILLDREVKGPAPTPLPVASPPSPPPADTAWSGEVLRQIREARGISLPLLSDRIKVTRHHIENIEADRFDLLPAPVYLRGILLSIARELRLDGQKVARSYLERITSGGGPRPA